MTAITRRSTRRKNDFYPTPAWATQTLLDRLDISGVILECCDGAGDISNALKQAQKQLIGQGESIILTNDIDPERKCDFDIDISQRWGWELLDRKIEFSGEYGADWIVTNPPFSLAPQIVPLAYEHAELGIAMLLRLSFLEPCLNRLEFLTAHPPTNLIVLPRISFTGDGGVDSVTAAWFVWDKRAVGQKIEIVRSIA